MTKYKIDWKKMDAILSVEEADKNYLFNDQIEQIKARCRDIIEMGEESSIISKNATFARGANKSAGVLRRESIIGIVGERGSGKSSLLRTACEVLGKENYYVLDVLDPNVFDDSMSILELFVSLIYKKLQGNDEYSDVEDYASMNLHQQLKKIIKILSDYQSGKENFYKTHTYSDLLESIMLRVNMPALIHNLVRNFLAFVKRRDHTEYVGLVLCIDDVDLVSNDKIYSLLEDIRKYLAGNIIVITAFRASQLFDAVLNEKLAENEKLIENKSIAINDVRDQVARYLEKLIPVHDRIRLLDADDLLSNTYYKIFHGLMDPYIANEDILREELSKILKEKGLECPKNVISMRDWLYYSLNLRIRMKLEPVDRWENTVYNLPVNLRGLLQLAHLILERMEPVDLEKETDNITAEKRRTLCKNILNNLEKFREYFLQNLQEILTAELYGIIELWQRSDYRAKNYLLCDELFKKIAKIDDSVLVGLPQYNLLQIYNVCIGDVYRMLEIYKSICGVEDKSRHFVYALKVLYGFELLTHYLKAARNCREEDSQGNEAKLDHDLEIYLTLINAKIIDSSFGYFTRNLWEGGIVYNGDNEGDVWNLCTKLLYSSVAVESELRRGIPRYEQTDGSRSKPLSRRTKISAAYDTLKYRRLYEYDWGNPLSHLQKGARYPIDPFAFLGQKKYVEQTYFEELYVFFSIFDIDILVRINYGRGDGTEQDRVIKLLNYVDRIFSYNKDLAILDTYESELIKGVSDSVFYSHESTKLRRKIFPDDNGAIKGLSGLIFHKGNVRSLSKKQFLHLIENILSDANIKLDQQEDDSLKNIEERLSKPRTNVNAEERGIVDNIIKKYKYQFDEETL